MFAAVMASYGEPDVLRWQELDDPQPGPNDVLIRVVACGVNHVDLDIRDGTSRLPVKLPHILGLEIAGVVEQLGSNVRNLPIGRSVAVVHQLGCGSCRFCLAGNEELCQKSELFGVHRPGGYATHVVAPASGVIPLPDGADLVAASVSQTTFSTAWHALVMRARLQPGETVLVNAAGSGVGTAAIQVARLLGGRVIAAAGSDEKLLRAAEAGACATINYRAETLSDRVLEETSGFGVDVVMECVGGSVFTESARALALGGRLVTVGGHAGEIAPVDIIQLFRHQASLLGSVRATRAEIRHVMNLVADGVLKPVIAQRVPLAKASEAHRMLSSRSVYGRIALTAS